MELTVAGGYFQPGKTPQIINKVNELIVLGYVPYGTPTYNEASGWVSQLMVLGYGGSATDYTLTTGYLDKTPYFPKKPPVNGNWVLAAGECVLEIRQEEDKNHLAGTAECTVTVTA